jgi:hypothetical protein
VYEAVVPLTLGVTETSRFVRHGHRSDSAHAPLRRPRRGTSRR